MSIKIEIATLDDLDLLVESRLEVIRVVFELPADEDLSVMEVANREYYKDAIPRGEHIACLAYLDNSFVGCGGACIHRQLPSPECTNGLCAYLMNIYTRPDFRGQGVGSHMTAWLVDHVQQLGVTRINLQATPDGQPVYEKLGFVSMGDFMELPR